MKESVAMQEIRKIRDENSLRHLKMTSDEMTKEFTDSVEWLKKKLGKEIKVVSNARVSL